MAKEVLEGDNGWRCFACKEFRRATKALTLWKLPSHLVVHLKRFGSGRRALTLTSTLPRTLTLIPNTMTLSLPKYYSPHPHTPSPRYSFRKRQTSSLPQVFLP